MQKQDIPYSEILSYLTEVDKRSFQSLNFTSKRLLLAQISQLNVDQSLFEVADKFDLYLQWIYNNRRYLTGIIKIRINTHTSLPILSRIVTIFNEFQFSNIKELYFHFSVPLTEEIKNEIYHFMEKMKKIQYLHVTAALLQIDFNNFFKHINHVIIEHNSLFPTEITNFFSNNSWKYLKHLSISACDSNIFSIISNRLLIDKTKLLSLELNEHQIDHVTPISAVFINSQKNLQKCRLTTFLPFNDDILQLQILCCSSTNLHTLYLTDVNDVLLYFIGQNCEYLQDLFIESYQFDLNDFQNFLKKNKFKSLNSLTIDEHFVCTNMSTYLPHLHKISLRGNSLNHEKTDLFLNQFIKLQSISFSVGNFYSSLPIHLQKYTNLTSLEIDFEHDFPDIYQFITILNILSLSKIRFLQLNIKNVNIQVIPSFFIHFKKLESLIIHIVHDVFLGTVHAEIQIGGFLDMIDNLDIHNEHLKIIDISFIDRPINIANHRTRFLRIKNKFPNLDKIRLGFGFFYYKPRFLL